MVDIINFQKMSCLQILTSTTTTSNFKNVCVFVCDQPQLSKRLGSWIAVSLHRSLQSTVRDHQKPMFYQNMIKNTFKFKGAN